MCQFNAIESEKKAICLVKNPQNCRLTIMHPILLPPDLSHMDVLRHPAASMGCTIPIYRHIHDGSPNDLHNPKIFMKKRPKRIYSFGLRWPAVFPACANLNPAVNRQQLFPRGRPEELVPDSNTIQAQRNLHRQERQRANGGRNYIYVWVGFSLISSDS